MKNVSKSSKLRAKELNERLDSLRESHEDPQELIQLLDDWAKTLGDRGEVALCTLDGLIFSWQLHKFQNLERSMVNTGVLGFVELRVPRWWAQVVRTYQLNTDCSVLDGPSTASELLEKIPEVSKMWDERVNGEPTFYDRVKQEWEFPAGRRTDRLLAEKTFGISFSELSEKLQNAKEGDVVAANDMTLEDSSGVRETCRMEAIKSGNQLVLTTRQGDKQ